MRSKLLHSGCGERSFAIILDSGDEAMHVLQEFAVREDVGGAQLTAIGVLGRHDGTALAGHLLEAHVRPTLEIIVRESPVHLCKVKDPASGLALIKL
jgi:uncharacterized protein